MANKRAQATRKRQYLLPLSAKKRQSKEQRVENSIDDQEDGNNGDEEDYVESQNLLDESQPCAGSNSGSSKSSGSSGSSGSSSGTSEICDRIMLPANVSQSRSTRPQGAACNLNGSVVQRGNQQSHNQLPSAGVVTENSTNDGRSAYDCGYANLQLNCLVDVNKTVSTLKAYIANDFFPVVKFVPRAKLAFHDPKEARPSFCGMIIRGCNLDQSINCAEWWETVAKKHVITQMNQLRADKLGQLKWEYFRTYLLYLFVSNTISLTIVHHVITQNCSKTMTGCPSRNKYATLKPSSRIVITLMLSRCSTTALYVALLANVNGTVTNTSPLMAWTLQLLLTKLWLF